MQSEVNEFMAYAKRELARGLGDWEQRLGTALVRSSPTDLVRTDRRAPAGDREPSGAVAQQSVEQVQRRTAAGDASD
jgi:hypothetical protein